MSLDVANKNNIELQKTIKKQSLHLTVHFYFKYSFNTSISGQERALNIILLITDDRF